ncbi:MAG TPA: transposase [Sphingomonas sp.]|nr:transposase [Sphingomonas sp.]
MPRLIDPGDGEAIGLDAFMGALDSCPLDLRDEDALASLGPLLARLGRNRTFLADRAIDDLKARCGGQAANAYGAQVMMLRPADGRTVLRANFWPAADDAVLRASGPAAFFYGFAHDHNFPFLTVGYLGPGYWSDYYDYDGDRVVGLPGEKAGLRFVERSRLEEGKLLLYRARRDVHVQHPPDRFSVSLNILVYDLAQPWRTQFAFDVAGDTILRPLTTTPSEALVTLAGHLGGGNGRDLIEHLARRHPHPRMRATAIDACASAAPDRAGRAAIYATACDDPDPHVAGIAAARLRAIAALEQAP